MVGSKANWVTVPETQGERQFQEYPEESLADWHARRGIST